MDLFNQPPAPDRVSNTHFNTTKEVGEKLKEYGESAGQQNKEVLAIFLRLKIASPSQVHSRMNTNAPLTSIRRAITTLTTDGHLIKTDTKVDGPFGRPEFVWRLNESILTNG